MLLTNEVLERQNNKEVRVEIWTTKDREYTQRKKTELDHQYIPQQALYVKFPEFRRQPGWPRTNWKDTVKERTTKIGTQLGEAKITD